MLVEESWLSVRMRVRVRVRAGKVRVAVNVIKVGGVEFESSNVINVRKSLINFTHAITLD